jgi:hypothetical protein
MLAGVDLDRALQITLTQVARLVGLRANDSF